MKQNYLVFCRDGDCHQNLLFRVSALNPDNAWDQAKNHSDWKSKDLDFIAIVEENGVVVEVTGENNPMEEII